MVYRTPRDPSRQGIAGLCRGTHDSRGLGHAGHADEWCLALGAPRVRWGDPVHEPPRHDNRRGGRAQSAAQPRARPRSSREKRCEMLRVAAASFVFGFLAVGLLLISSAFGLAIIADVRGWDSFNVGSGVLTIISYRRVPDGTQTVIGAGTIMLALLAGVLNAVAGAVLWARTPSRR